MSFQHHDRYAQEAYDRIFDHPILSHERHLALARKIEKGDFNAKNELIRCNMKLAGKQAHHFAGVCQHLTFDDLFAAAVLGLTRAAEKYDYRKNMHFSTYATFWIKNFLQNEITNVEKPIRIATDAHRKVTKLRKARLQGSTPPTIAELEERTGLSEAQIVAFDNITECCSLDTPLIRHPESTLLDLVPDPRTDQLDAPDFNNPALIARIARLPRVDRQILIGFAIEERTQANLAEELGIPESEVSRRHIRTIRALRSESKELLAA